MRELQLLDCTLRDGGFVNDWHFGHGDIINIFERLTAAHIDIIEIGFLDARRAADIQYSIMPDTEMVNQIFRDIRKRPPMVVGMIDYGTCPIENICDKQDSFMDGIRVIFKKKDAEKAIAFCALLRDKGYKVFVQPVSVTGYSDEEMLRLVEQVNLLQPFSMSVVDTYGLLHKDNLFHYFHLLNDHLDPQIGIGYHSHNNFQLAYANCIELMEQKMDRLLVIDASVYGMGKGAGNANLELIAMYMNDHCGKNYDINQILEIIDVNILPIYNNTRWGYSLKFYLAASNDCHPEYVSYLLKKRTLSAKSVNEILRSLEPQERLSYNAAYIESLYLSYQTRDLDDSAALMTLRDRFHDRELLIVGPGKSVHTDNAAIARFTKETNPISISINYLPDTLATDYIFISNSKRYVPLSNRLASGSVSAQTIATSNVSPVDSAFDFGVEYQKLLDPDFFISDNSLLMILKLLSLIGVKKVSLAGFDGYKADKDGGNYLDLSMEYSFSTEKAKAVNSHVIASLSMIRKNGLDIHFITESLYDIDVKHETQQGA